YPRPSSQTPQPPTRAQRRCKIPFYLFAYTILITFPDHPRGQPQQHTSPQRSAYRLARRLEPLHGTQAHQGAREQQTTDKGKQRARSEETVQDPKDRPNQTGSVGIEVKTVQEKAKERREQVEGNIPNGQSSHGSQGRYQRV
ncbi:hypothetical protein PTTG_06307, partial [Puccinia triticina 1-1 BBBD Race 1]